MKTTMLLSEITTTRAQRIRAAHDRHTVSTPVIIFAEEMAHSTIINLITAASRDASTALRARYRASGQQFMNDLNQQIPHDVRRMTSTESKASTADEERKTAAAIREEAQRYDLITKRIQATEEERAAAAAIRDNMRAQANEHSGHAADINKHISHTAHSDAADIIQNAVIARLESIRSTGHQDHRKSISAAGASINSLAAAKGYTSTRTKVKPIEAEEVQTLAAKWHMYTTKDESGHIKIERVPVSVLGQSTAYFTIEYRNTDRFPAGYYHVTHYATTAPIRLDSYAKGAKDEEGSTYAETLKELHTYDMSDAERDHEPQLQALIKAANLTERERNILAWSTDNHNPASVAVGVKAVDLYMKRTDERAEAASNSRAAAAIRNNAAKRAEIVRQRARIEAAMQVYNVPAAARRMAKSRIRAKIEAAQVFAPLWYMIDNTPTAARAAAPEAHDLIIWSERSTAADPAPVISWKRKPYAYTAQPVTAAQLAAEEQERQQEQRKHDAEAAALAFRREVRDAAQATTAEVMTFKPFDPTPYTRPAASAKAAAYAFINAWSAEDVCAWYEAMQAEKARNERRKAAAKASGIYSLNSTFEQWQKWTKEERAEHIRFLNSL